MYDLPCVTIIMIGYQMLMHIVIFIYFFIPIDADSDLKLYYLQLAVLLMPDESRDALRFLLEFLNDVASQASTHQVYL